MRSEKSAPGVKTSASFAKSSCQNGDEEKPMISNVRTCILFLTRSSIEDQPFRLIEPSLWYGKSSIGAWAAALLSTIRAHRSRLPEKKISDSGCFRGTK